ncbi:sucrose synthase-like [Actinidia eriantha]|uniref:sucrose synthase-like n=1 Tax=Actinidia eriantha TaxID=165200 RepID=UPI00258DB9D4|nr:sucrose synthase-like [Actinidia eriantha]XP_057501508.1 sucrose synthase-like [Actinidia eriantha]
MEVVASISRVHRNGVRNFYKNGSGDMAGQVLTRVHRLRERLDGTLSAQRNQILLFLSKMESHGKGILKPHQIEAEIEALSKAVQQKLYDGAFGELLKSAQETIVLPPRVAFAVWLRPSVWENMWVNLNALVVEELSVPKYLQFKEELDGWTESAMETLFLSWILSPSLHHFFGQLFQSQLGMELSSLTDASPLKMFHDKENRHPLLDFLEVHNYKGKTMMLNDRIQNLNALQFVLRKILTLGTFFYLH